MLQNDDSIRVLQDKLYTIKRRQAGTEKATRNNTKEIEYLNEVVWQRSGEHPPITEQLAIINSKLDVTIEMLNKDLKRLDKSVSTNTTMLWGLASAIIVLLAGALLTNLPTNKKAEVVNPQLFVDKNNTI